MKETKEIKEVLTKTVTILYIKINIPEPSTRILSPSNDH